MKNLLLLTKYIAIEKELEEISIVEINEAFELLNITNKKAYDDMIELLSKVLLIVDGGKSKRAISKQMLESARKIRTQLAYDKSAIDFLDEMQKKSYGINTSKIKFNNIVDNRDFEDFFTKRAKKYKKRTEDLSNINAKLKKEIIGQNHAIDVVLETLKRDTKNANSPKYTFLFLGPSGVGKTMLAKEISNSFDEYKFLNIDMTSYTKNNDGQKLFGTEKGWNTESNGLLTSFVFNNPKTIVFLDEFEKAHNDIQKKLLSIFSEGVLEDGLGWDNDGDTVDSTSKLIDVNDIVFKVDFTQTIFIIASNLGKKLYTNDNFIKNQIDNYDEVESMIINEISQETKFQESKKVSAILPEMISRLSAGKMVLFNNLYFKDTNKIALNTLTKKFEDLEKQFNIKLVKNAEFNKAVSCLCLSFLPKMDIRRITSKIYEKVNEPIDKFLSKNNILYSDINDINFVVSNSLNKLFNKIKISNDENFIKELIRKNKTFNLSYSVTYLKSSKSIIFKINDLKEDKVQNVTDMIGSGSILFEVPDTTFDEIIGHEKVKERLKNISKLLSNKKLLEEFNSIVPKGMLLYGSAGTGKTMLARALANYADLPFIQTTANDLIDLKKNDMSHMKKIFDRAKQYAPSIIFIDEIDTIGNRSKNGNSYIINELLTQIDGFSKDNNDVFIIAATNHKENIDPALLRAGRLELHFEIENLDKEARKVFIEKYFLSKPCESKIDLDKLATYSSGLNGSQLMKIANESALHCIKNGISKISQEIVLEQINIEKYGEKKEFKDIEKHLAQTAYHEAGHAVLSYILFPHQKLEQITIVPRKDSLGFVSYEYDENLLNYTKQELLNKINVLYAGRLAQMKKFENEGIDLGASNDLSKASKIAYDMITKYGMDDKLGFVCFDGLGNLFKDKIEEQLLDLLNYQRKETIDLIEKNWTKIELLSKVLVSKQTVSYKDFISIMQFQKADIKKRFNRCCLIF